MKRWFLLLLTCLPLAAYAQVAWPRDAKSGDIRFVGKLLWPAEAKTVAQRQDLLRHWLQKWYAPRPAEAEWARLSPRNRIAAKKYAYRMYGDAPYTALNKFPIQVSAEEGYEQFDRKYFPSWSQMKPEDAAWSIPDTLTSRSNPSPTHELFSYQIRTYYLRYDYHGYYYLFQLPYTAQITLVPGGVMYRLFGFWGTCTTCCDSTLHTPLEEWVTYPASSSKKPFIDLALAALHKQLSANLAHW